MANFTEQDAAENAVDWRRWSYSQFGRMPSAWRKALDQDPHLRDARVVVDLVFGRSRRVTVMGGLGAEEYQAGQVRPFRIRQEHEGTELTVWPALLDEPALEDVIELSNSGVSASPRKLQISLWGELVDPKELIRSGWPVYGVAEVSLMLPDIAWEQRIVWLRGNITASSHAGRRELVTVTISDPVFQAQEIPQWVLDEDRFSNLDDSAVGERVPIVVNGAYRMPCPRVSAATATPGQTNSFVAVAGHGFSTSAVFVNGEQVGATAYDFTKTVDDTGLPVCLVEFGVDSGDEGWVEDRASVYARLAETNVRSFGVIQSARLLMERYGEGPRKNLSLRLFGEAEARMSNIGDQVSGGFSPYIAINAPTTVEQYIRDTLFAEYAMCVLAWEEDGLGPIVLDSRAEPVGELTPGVYPVLGRPAGIQYEWSPLGNLRNRFTLRYWYDAQLNLFRKVLVRSAENSTVCAWSKVLTKGEQPAGEMELITVTDTPTANLLLDWWVEHAARPACDVTLDCHPEAWFMFRRGDAVRYMDPEVGFSNERALVLRRFWKSGRVELTLRVFPNLQNKLGGGAQVFG